MPLTSLAGDDVEFAKTAGCQLEIATRVAFHYRMGKHLVPRLILRNLSAFALFTLSAGVTSAATFSWTVNCPANAVVGPVTVLALTYSGSVTLTQGVSSTVDLILPLNDLTQEDNNAALQGTYSGLLVCTLTLGGVTVPFTRSFSLNVPPPGPTGSGTMTTAAVSLVVDLGAQGTVNVSAPVALSKGFDRALINGGIIIVPQQLTTLLLTQAAISAVPTLSGWGLTALLGSLLGSGLLLLRGTDT